MLKKIENNFVYILFLIFSIYILFLNIIGLREMVVLKVILTIIMSFLLIFLIKKIMLYKNKKYIKIISILLLILDFILMLYLGYKLRVDFSWDYGIVQSEAINYGINGNISRENLIYYIKYPNNRLLFATLAVIYRIVNFVLGVTAQRYFVYVSIIIGSFLITLSYFLTYLLAKKYKDENFGLVVLIILSLMIPLLSYSAILYSDTPSLFFFPLILLLYLKYKDNKKLIYLLLISIISVIGFEIKATIIFAFLAIIVDIICNNKFIDILKRVFIMLIIFVIAHLIFSASMNKVLKITDSDIDRYNVPYTHFVMMTLNESGGFNEDDVVFTNSFNTKKEKTNENIRVIKERLNNRGVLGTLHHLFIKKMIRTWNRSDFAISDYINRYPIKKNYLNNIIGESGDYFKYFKVYTDAYYLIIIIGLIMSYFKKNKDINILIMMIILFLTMFLTIWECNSRYVVQLLPIIVLLSLSGWVNTIESRK